ncbi:MAG TPA: hypothetical protein PLQ13_05680, partial [Candidatus Krumholzibacteria bacterium]|nr:hypothetical protein [Candidatus Krumholzibacteria bacterium]
LPAGAQERNLIGLVNDPDCPLVVTPSQNPCFAELYCGVQQIFLVAYNVWNDSLAAPITNIGGFEGKLVLPPEVLMLGVEMSPASINFKPLPEFVVGTNIPVDDEQTTLAVITVLVPEYVGDTLYARLTPVHVAYQSIPGRLAITDANDGFRLMAVDPYGAGGLAEDYTEPMLYFGDPHGQGAPCVVGDVEKSWGTLKALYR